MVGYAAEQRNDQPPTLDDAQIAFRVQVCRLPLGSPKPAWGRGANWTTVSKLSGSRGAVPGRPVHMIQMIQWPGAGPDDGAGPERQAGKTDPHVRILR